MKIRIGSLLIVLFMAFLSLAQSITSEEVHPYSTKYIDNWSETLSDIGNIKWLKTELGLGASEDLVLKRKTEGNTGTHFQYVHLISGSEVIGSGVNLHLYKNGKALLQNYLINATTLSIDPISAETPYLILKNSRLNACYRVLNDDIRQQWEYRNAKGDLILQTDRYQYFKDTTVKAKVFMVNPVNSARTSYGGMYRDFGDQSNDSLEAQQYTVDMYAQFRNDSFFLKHPKFSFQDVSAPFYFDPYTNTTDTFFYTRDNKRFEAVNIFYHLTTYHDQLVDLGFESLMEPVQIDPHGIGGSDNSRFDPLAYTLEYGDGNVDDAEDGEVVLHEYAHSLSTTANYTIGNGKQRDAMEEGNCDYLSKSYSRSVNDYNSYNVFSWDGHNEFWNGFIINSTERYPDDLKNFTNADRDIWSSALMCIYDFIGRETTDELVLEHLSYQYNTATMPDMAEIIMHLDTVLNAGANYEPIKECFVQKGFMQRSVSIEDISTSDQFSVLNSAGFVLGTANAEIKSDEEFNIVIYNVNGQLMREAESVRSFSLSPEEFAKGLYIVQITQAQKQYSLKLIR